MPQESLLYQEIHHQPDVLASLLTEEREHVAEIVDHIRRQGITHAVIAARGTSDNAARYAQYLFGSVNRLQVALATPSLFSIYKRPPRFGNALVIGISQSGKSPDIVSVVAEGKRQGAITVAITNTPHSDMGQAADHVINLHAGLEQSVAATKTYSTSLAAIALLSATAAGDQQMLADLQQIPGQIRQTLALSPHIAQSAERYRYMRVCVVIGRGYNYATAFELALKVKELNYVMAEPYSSADFMHGPVAVVEEAFPTIVVAPSGVMLPEMTNMIGDLKERGAEVIAISDDDQALSLARTAFRLPVTVPEWVSPLISIIPGQLFAMHLAHVRDYDIDRPRGLRKITETT
ncbi:MAG: SIS domain-containing protein [Chloroflexi bacterium]|jgi:glucosamine--fructose-6-phosphate aminotransferase (isomerizing)|nr:SIS domain-containing protein [Chloroflexota bacterium]